MSKERRAGKMEKAVSVLLVISLLGFSQNLIAGERHGAMLSVQKKDGHQENGELIAVKPSSLLILDWASGADVTIEVSDISTIKVVKKSRAWTGLGWGALGGAAIGAIIGLASGDDPQNEEYGWGNLFRFSAGEKALAAGVALGIVGGLVGLTAGALAGTDKTIQFEGKSDLEIQLALGKLKQKARIPDFK
jgi:hypothetical protein